MLHAEGVSYLLEGDPDRADAIFARATDAATRAGVVPFIPVLLTERGIAAAERNDWPAADSFAERAMATMQAGRFDDYWTSALVYAWAARVAMQRGDRAHGRHYVALAARLRPLLNYALPLVPVRALLEMTRAYVALGDAEGARAVLRQANDIFQQRPDLGVLPEEADDLRTKLDSMLAGAQEASSLTTAELRLLPFMATHLSLAEIGERLYVSRNTIKTQAISIYRKLGVSSRSEAIARMHDLGLLEHT
jgi:LuxR family maltose regulon positive regulatory protein